MERAIERDKVPEPLVSQKEEEGEKRMDQSKLRMTAAASSLSSSLPAPITTTSRFTGRSVTAGQVFLDSEDPPAIGSEEQEAHQSCRITALSAAAAAAAASSSAAAAAAASSSSHIDCLDSSRHEEMCVVCYDNQQNAVLLTCGHGSLCFSCAVDVYRSTRECPLCRSKVDQIVTVGEQEMLPNGLLVVPVIGP